MLLREIARFMVYKAYRVWLGVHRVVYGVEGLQGF